MKMAKMRVLLIVLGLCLPSYGEILVYKYTGTGTGIEQRNGDWRVQKETPKGYIVVQVNYADHTITRAERIEYGTEAGGKVYYGGPMDLDLVRMEEGSRVRWVILMKGLEVAGQEVTGNFFITAGTARNRNIGAGENREAANTVSGYVLSDTTDDGDREFGMFKLSLTLYPAWTYWANGNQGHMDVDATVQMIDDNLTAKGYTLRP
jgi:hypothetical protein